MLSSHCFLFLPPSSYPLCLGARFPYVQPLLWWYESQHQSGTFNVPLHVKKFIYTLNWFRAWQLADCQLLLMLGIALVLRRLLKIILYNRLDFICFFSGLTLVYQSFFVLSIMRHLTSYCHVNIIYCQLAVGSKWKASFDDGWWYMDAIVSSSF